MVYLILFYTFSLGACPSPSSPFPLKIGSEWIWGHILPCGRITCMENALVHISRSQAFLKILTISTLLDYDF